MRRALQTHGKLAIRGHKFKTAINTRHWTYRNEAPSGAPRQAAHDPSIGGFSVRAPERLPGGAMTQKDAQLRCSLSAHHAAVEPHLIRRSYAYAQRCLIAVDGQTAGANPHFGFAARCQAQLRQHLLQTFGGLLACCRLARLDQESKSGPQATSSRASDGAASCSSSSPLSSSKSCGGA